MNIAYLLIGGNLGDRKAYLNEAKSAIAAQCGKIEGQSLIYETEPWGVTNQTAYLNQALKIFTQLDPFNLLSTTKSIEISLGRNRDGKYTPRTIDIDILYFNDLIIHNELLVIPHPRISERKFALIPMNEIAPMHSDPAFGITIKEMLNNCKDSLEVRAFELNVDNKDI